ncbi:MAG TPA: sulfotransferase domain-containing protein [Aggregatilineaceae bacterium]|nr:sulfotransferase domain-containing protein [Aggregatilineaceae bacterium]
MMKLLKKLMAQSDIDAQEGSTAVSPSVIEAFIANEANPFLVSFPRTGSHWLRMLIELYFERPSLVRVFYYPDQHDYMFVHTHDMDIDLVRTHVIYLYRDPVDTIYSQLNYHKENPDDEVQIAHWSDLYGRHLDKWLHQETFTTQKMVLTYEGMKRDLPAEFAKVTRFFGQPFDPDRLQRASERVTKNEVKRKTQHDPQVIQLQPEYEMTRQVFREKHGALVWDVLTAERAHLKDDFATP